MSSMGTNFNLPIELSPEATSFKDNNMESYMQLLDLLSKQSLATLFTYLLNPESLIFPDTSEDFMLFFKEFLPKFIKITHNWTDEDLLRELEDYKSSVSPNFSRPHIKSCSSCGADITGDFAVNVTADAILSKTPVLVICPICGNHNYFNPYLERGFKMHKYDSIDAIRYSFLTEESLDNSNTSRLTIPLNTAHKNVASSIAIIGNLSPAQRKDASLKLLDIAEAAMQALEKTLKRSGTADAALLSRVVRATRTIKDIDELFTQLPISESDDYSGYDPESEPISVDPDGTPSVFGSNVDKVSVLGILSDNSDIPEEPFKDSDIAAEPIEGEATDLTIDAEEKEDKLISTLASLSDNSKDTELPEEFYPKGDNESIHESPSENLKLLDILLKTI